MAKSYPERFPRWAQEDPKRSAERKVFEALTKLPDSYTFFYRVGWQVRNLKNEAQDGEADFVLAHPDLGVMIFEVKGGQIRYDASQQKWFSKDRNGIEYEIKDPVEQARNSKGALLSKLKELPEWDQRFLTIAYLVIFPDVLVEQRLLRPDLPRQIVADATDLNNLEAKIQETFEWFHGEEKTQGTLGTHRLRVLENLLGRSFTLRTPMGTDLEYEEQRLIELTEDQMRLLQAIQTHRRALIEGCAGSGKTTLALEKARHLAEQGFDTLLLCFNAPLAEYLRRRAPKGVDVFYFHDLCKHFAKQAGIGYRACRTEQEYYDQVLPQMLLDAIDGLGPQYDAIVVDEGQDFQEHWWETLFFLLRDSQNGIFYVFYDSNQNIYRRPNALMELLGVQSFTLWENCRNTRAIHNVVKEFHHAPHQISCRGPEGRTPEIYYFSTSQQQEELVKKILHTLVNEEKVDVQHIVLLTTRSPDKTPFYSGRKLGNFVLMEWGDLNLRKTDLRVSSVHRFKGLESRVIVLTGLDDNDPSWLNPLLYVACSRARTHLVVIGHERSRPQVERIFAHPRGKA